MRLHRLAVLFLLVVLVGAACGGEDGGDDGEDGAGDTTTTAAGGALEPGAGGSLVVLEAGGLIVDRDQRLTFGEASEDEVVDALRTALGEPLSEEELSECGEGPLRAVNFPSLGTYFANGTFAGWTVASNPTEILTTVDGIRKGSTRAEVEEAHPDAVVEETSLGTELTVGSGDGPFLSALLSDDSPAGTVEELWSGSACIAR